MPFAAEQTPQRNGDVTNSQIASTASTAVKLSNQRP
jgi:hypothetical protein